MFKYVSLSKVDHKSCNENSSYSPTCSATAFIASTSNLPTTFHFLNSFTSQVYCTVPPKYGPCGSLDAAGSPHEIFNIFVFLFFLLNVRIKALRKQKFDRSNTVLCILILQSCFPFYEIHTPIALAIPYQKYIPSARYTRFY